MSDKENGKSTKNKRVGVQKGAKRGTYKRAAMKREMQSDAIQEDGMTYSEIARVLEITIGEVKKIEADALRKLRKPSDKNKTLRDYSSIGDLEHK